ncbi:hypothetical protein PO909_024663 [Leuciscus waleckii]
MYEVCVFVPNESCVFVIKVSEWHRIIGETVNLKCVTYSNWRYEWYKDSVILQTSERYTVNRDTLTIRGATESDQGQYWCKGQRDGRPNSSTSSSAVSLSVVGQSDIVLFLKYIAAKPPLS